MSKATAVSSASAAQQQQQQQQPPHRYVESAALKDRIRRFAIADANNAAYLPKQHQLTSGSIFQQNQKIVADGGIKTGSVFYKLFNNVVVEPAVSIPYSAEDAAKFPPMFEVTEYCIVQCDTVTTSIAMMRNPNVPAEEDEQGVPPGKLASHNFANATTPGGYYSCGTMVRAQEETICAQLPNLFPSLLAASEQGKYPIPVGTALVSTVAALRNPATLEICLTASKQTADPFKNKSEKNNEEDKRDDSATILKDYSSFPGFGTFKIITSAMPIHGGRRPAGGYMSEQSEWLKQVEPVVLATLQAAVAAGCDTFIGGAAGAGAFGNPPREIAHVFKKVLTERFRGRFRYVVFAIVDPMGTGNFKPFVEGMHGMV